MRQASSATPQPCGFLMMRKRKSCAPEFTLKTCRFPSCTSAIGTRIISAAGATVRQEGGAEPEDNRGCSEETVERNFDGTLEEENSDGNGSRETENGADPRLQAVAGKLDGAKN